MSPEKSGHSGENARPGGSDYLRMYPLETAASRQERRTQPPSQRRPVQQQMRTPAAKPEYTMAPPQMRGNTAQGAMRNSIGQAMPQAGNPKEQTPAQPITPDQAVQFFQRANKGLPDGVRYEPLDDATMRLLREHGHLPHAPEGPQTADQPMQAPQASREPMQAPPMPPQQGQAAMPIVQPPSLPQMSTSPMSMPPSTPWTASPLAAASHTPQHAASTSDTQSLSKTIQGLIQDERNAHIFYSSLAKIAPASNVESALADIANDSRLHTTRYSEVLLKQFGHGFEPVETEINTGLEFKDALALALEEENKSLRALTRLLENVANAESEIVIQRVINKKIVNYNQLEMLFGRA